MERNNSEKNWLLFELMDADNRILIIAPYVCRSLYMLTYTCICRRQHAAVFSQKLFIQECICAYGTECIHALPVSGGGGGGGQVILKRTDNHRKDCP